VCFFLKRRTDLNDFLYNDNNWKKGGTMKRLIYPMVILSLLMFACNVSTTPISLPQIPVPLTETQPVVTNPAPVPPTETQLVATNTPAEPQANVTCNELSFYLDPALATGYTCTTVPARPVGINPNPQYTEVTLTGYQLGDRSESPQIDVFPTQGYLGIYPDGIKGFQSDLQTLIDGGVPGDSLPFLNPYEAAQLFYAQYEVLNLASSSGIRYLTQYAQNFVPINNHDMFYTYQGMTSDTTYMITIMLPISYTMLPESSDTLPEGMTWEQFSNNYHAYLTDLKPQLNSLDPNAFTPSLIMLDTLASSIIIHP
jgi:hypothetical protein